MKKIFILQSPDFLKICSEKSLKVINLIFLLLFISVISVFGRKNDSETAKLNPNLKDADPLQQLTVKGKITDSQTVDPMPGVNIIIKGTSTGTLTDAAGNFSLSVPDGNATLVLSFIGYKTQEVPLNGRTTIDVAMKAEITGLEEVIVIGYGTQKKVNLTGAVSSVSSADIAKRPIHNVSNSLQGKVTGLRVIQPSGEPGNDNATLQVRGLGTFSSAGSSPLVLIDGIQSDLTKIIPEDVESISVLKDAASASIYGARAANGVILVTTKKGKAGELSIEYTSNYQIQQPTRMPEFLTNSADFMTYVNQANARNGQINYYSQTEIDAFRNGTDPIKYPNFNWIDYMIKNGGEQRHHLSLSGGNDKTKFNLSLGYLDQKGIIINNSYDYKKFNAMLNIDSKLNKVVSFGSNFLATYSDRNYPVMNSQDLILEIYSAGPNYLPKLSDGSGRWTWRYNNADWHNRNPEQSLYYGDERTNLYSLAAQAYVDVNIFKDLVFEIKGALNSDVSFMKHHEVPVPSYFYVDNSLAALITGYNPGVTDNYQQNILTTVYSTLNYSKSFSNHNIHALLGYSQEANNYRYLKGFKLTFPSDALTELDAGSTATQTINGSANTWALVSFFGRVNYDFSGKYLLEGNFRYDGSSRIAKDQRWGLFPSVSAGWRMSEESFMKGLSWLDNLKLRASWGQLGNQNIGNYPYQDILETSGITYPYTSSPESGAAQTRLVDKELTWETTTVTDIGVDFSIKNGLFSLTADWFDKVTDNILYQISIPSSIGLSAPTVNYAKMGNKGFEFEVGHAQTLGDFRYNVSLNFTTFKNEVLKVKTPTYGTTTVQEGLPWNTFYLIEWIGIFQNQAEIDAGPKHQYNPKPGDLKFRDANNDGKIDANDRVPVDGQYPKFYYGGNINLTWKNFDLTAFLQGVQGQKIYVSGWGWDPFTQGCAPTTYFLEHMWTGENSTNEWPAMYKNGYPAVTSTPNTYRLQDASYFRLKNLMIGYNFPARLCQKIAMKSLRIYLSGDNLATITKYPLADPEWLGGGYGFATYPQIKSYTFGLSVKF
jgi:TonB-linked SusC/RagA family outer membrane protein